MDLEPVAIMLQLVRPTRAARRLRYNNRAAGMDKGGRSAPRTHAIHGAQILLCRAQRQSALSGAFLASTLSRLFADSTQEVTIETSYAVTPDLRGRSEAETIPFLIVGGVIVSIGWAPSRAAMFAPVE
jgi:hypothetical protein